MTTLLFQKNEIVHKTIRETIHFLEVHFFLLICLLWYFNKLIQCRHAKPTSLVISSWLPNNFQAQLTRSQGKPTKLETNIGEVKYRQGATKFKNIKYTIFEPVLSYRSQHGRGNYTKIELPIKINILSCVSPSNSQALKDILLIQL